MGAKGGKPAADLTQDETDAFFKESEAYSYSGCIDLVKLRNDLGIEAATYAAYQVHL